MNRPREAPRRPRRTAPYLDSEMWASRATRDRPRPSLNSVILSEGRSPKPKDPEELTLTHTLNPFSPKALTPAPTQDPSIL
jgi:hypothetical protein